ncbi:MAG: hypothetical protein ACR2MD_11855 [Aridibacter sp.]
MKNPNEIMTEEGFPLKFRERESEEIMLKIPKDVLASLEKVAQKRDMSVQGLLKLYIGQNLRQDLANYFSDNVLEKTEEVLSRHLQNKEEVNEILREIKLDLVA